MPTTATPNDVDLHAMLKQHFGFDEFRPGQREVIEHLLAGRSAAAVFPTGGGKSLCYQLPALLLPGLTLVVSPLIALMKDQIDALTRRNIAAARLDSTLSADEYRQVMEDVRAGRLRLLYVAPERFNNERFREMIARVRVSLFAVDEAHCISEWGHNFRPDYLKLAAFARQCKAERLFALTATATESVLRDVCREFRIEDGCAVRTGFYRENLTLLSTPVSTDERDDVLLGRLHERLRGPTIVYVTLQRTSEEVAARLASAGFPARHYHAGMKSEQRAPVQDWFMASDDGIVVATIAFGMGIDKANIRYVYHYNTPKSLENYSQEIGRAGRDGAPSTCELFLCRDDLNVLENFIYGDTPTAVAVRSLVDEVFSLGEQFDLSVYDAAHTHDIRDLVVRTLLTYLQLEGYLEGGTPFYANYQFKPRMSSAEILTRFEGERRDFVARMLAQAVKAKTWFSIDLERAAAEIESIIARERERPGRQPLSL
ncbi:MAG: ATP-dependent DNA helicase RecQ [Planctomycetes bacterium]|nr:ATP-dependent DNA helicase RecQ [Planctomycetota bacterium]